jgi:hypothetical protein
MFKDWMPFEKFTLFYWVCFCPIDIFVGLLKGGEAGYLGMLIGLAIYVVSTLVYAYVIDRLKILEMEETGEEKNEVS